MRLVALREIPEDSHLRQQWNSLAERVDQPQVFYTYEWAMAVQRAYHATLVPLLFLSYDQHDSLCGVAALATDSSDDRASFLCATTGDYCDFLSLTEDSPPFVDAVLGELRQLGVQNISLANLPADSATAAGLRRSARQHGYRIFARTGYVCAQVSFRSLRRERGEKPETPRPKMVRRFLRAMSQQAPVHLDHARTWDSIQPLLPELMQAHIARFLVTGRISNMAQPERRVFLEELARLLSESGWLTLSRLVSGDKSYAWNYGFQFQGTWFWYQPTFDSDWEKFSPGFCLLSKLIEQAAGDPAINTVDLGLGAEDYKERFANRTRETLYVTLKASAPAHLREMVRYRASDLLRQFPRADLRLRSWAETVRGCGALKVLRTGAKNLQNILWTGAEVLFLEWCGPDSTSTGGLKIQALDLNGLADATAQYSDDAQTLAYLLRGALRVRASDLQGWALVDTKGSILHSAWATAFDNCFVPELNRNVGAPATNATMIFDCWTPVARQGRGYQEQATALVANCLRASGRAPWIYIAATNTPAIREMEGVGFQRRFSIFGQRILGWWRMERRMNHAPSVHSDRKTGNESALR